MAFDFSPHFRGARVLVTGGLGFLGSALARRLAKAGARVRVLDSLHAACGGSPHNLGRFARDIEIIIDDTRSRSAAERAVRGATVVFHCAGASPDVAAWDAAADLEAACLGTHNLMHAARLMRQRTRFVYASSRLVYSDTALNPVKEDAQTDPSSLHGIHHLSAEKYVLANCGSRVDAVIARLGEVFGPGIRSGGGYGSFAYALSAALAGEPIAVHSGGETLVDLLPIDDAVACLVALGASSPASGQVFNVASGKRTRLREMYQWIGHAVGSGKILDLPLPARVRLADFTADVGKLTALLKRPPCCSDLRRSMQTSARKSMDDGHAI